MSLDGCPSDAELLRIKAEREGRSRKSFAIEREPLGESVSGTFTGRMERVPGSYIGMQEFRIVPIVEPVALRIPWSCLISDNARKKPARRGEGVIEVMTPEYRAAKKAIAALAADVMQGRPPADCPLSLVARVWVPNVNRRDVVNLSKALHDALTGIVFTDDHWLHDTRWIRAGVDVDAPRAEILISPLST